MSKQHILSLDSHHHELLQKSFSEDQIKDIEHLFQQLVKEKNLIISTSPVQELEQDEFNAYESEVDIINKSRSISCSNIYNQCYNGEEKEKDRIRLEKDSVRLDENLTDADPEILSLQQEIDSMRVRLQEKQYKLRTLNERKKNGSLSHTLDLDEKKSHQDTLVIPPNPTANAIEAKKLSPNTSPLKLPPAGTPAPPPPYPPTLVPALPPSLSHPIDLMSSTLPLCPLSSTKTSTTAMTTTTNAAAATTAATAATTTTASTTTITSTTTTTTTSTTNTATGKIKKGKRVIKNKTLLTTDAIDKVMRKIIIGEKNRLLDMDGTLNLTVNNEKMFILAKDSLSFIPIAVLPTLKQDKFNP
eukprot:Awhi_evm1s3646